MPSRFQTSRSALSTSGLRAISPALPAHGPCKYSDDDEERSVLESAPPCLVTRGWLLLMAVTMPSPCPFFSRHVFVTAWGFAVYAHGPWKPASEGGSSTCGPKNVADAEFHASVHHIHACRLWNVCLEHSADSQALPSFHLASNHTYCARAVAAELNRAGDGEMACC